VTWVRRREVIRSFTEVCSDSVSTVKSFQSAKLLSSPTINPIACGGVICQTHSLTTPRMMKIAVSRIDSCRDFDFVSWASSRGDSVGQESVKIKENSSPAEKNETCFVRSCTYWSCSSMTHTN
jgi:hypothetical protein